MGDRRGAEVGNHGGRRIRRHVHEDVFRFQVSMDHAVRVRDDEPFENDGHNAQCFKLGEHAFGHEVTKGFSAFDVLVHDREHLAFSLHPSEEGPRLDDVRGLSELYCDGAFVFESANRRGARNGPLLDLDCDFAVVGRIGREPDLSVGTVAEKAHEAVLTVFEHVIGRVHRDVGLLLGH